MNRTLRRTGLALAALAVTVAATACAGTDAYDREIPLEAHWKCDVQHRTYSDLGEMTDDLNERLASEGISAESYAGFKADMESSASLRSEVLAAYTAYCGEDTDA